MCLHPIMAWRNKLPNPSGNYGIHFKPSIDDSMNYPLGEIGIPCGKCLGCLDDRRKYWVNRMLLELNSVIYGTFVTLTYRNAPDSLSKSDAQKFIKRLRHAVRDYSVIPFHKDFKYFLCGERGSKKGRPHYHAILFGCDMFDPSWQPYIATFENGYPVYSSRVLEKIWNLGFVTIGEVNSSSIRYVAKYVCKSSEYEDQFTLKSMRLGVSSFFDVTRDGRKTKYKYKYSDSYYNLLRGTIHIPSKNGDCLEVRVPKSILEYSRYISNSDFIDISLMRDLDAIEFLSKPFDYANYESLLIDKNKKEKIKRKLDNDK